jgi:dihydroorotate dehydrogenase (fumarate)
VIASLNGSSAGGWIDHAQSMEAAGADAIELNIYHVATDPDENGRDVEARYLDVLRAVRDKIKIPLALKLGPYFSSFASMARAFDDAGANALVLFNRFYQPDIDLENLEVFPNLQLSGPQDLRLPLRWIAILHGRLRASLAATSGVDSARDIVKLLLAGADVTMVCSTLLRNGPRHHGVLLAGLRRWLEENEYESVAQLKGSMSQRSCSDPAAFERANYMRALNSFQRS